MNRIKLLLRRKRRTQRWLATKLSVSEPTIAHWCAGLSLPTPAGARKIAELLSVSVEELKLRAPQQPRTRGPEVSPRKRRPRPAPAARSPKAARQLGFQEQLNALERWGASARRGGPRAPSRAQVTAEFRRWAKECHPDRGGSHELMVHLNSEWTAIRRHRGWL